MRDILKDYAFQKRGYLYPDNRWIFIMKMSWGESWQIQFDWGKMSGEVMNILTHNYEITLQDDNNNYIGSAKYGVFYIKDYFYRNGKVVVII